MANYLMQEEETIIEEIEEFINEKYPDLVGELFEVPPNTIEDENVIYFEEGVSRWIACQVLVWMEDEESAKTLEQGLKMIPESIWDKWLSEWSIYSTSCSCSRGCRYCLGTEY